MPTGSGKSLVYQLAALLVDGLTVVISPLIALMEDQVSALRQRNIPATYINSAVPAYEQRRRLQAFAAGAYRLVYVAPERFRNRLFRDTLERVHVGLLAVDEAHCISEWGHDFRPDYRRIAAARRLMGDPLIVALTATATPRVQDDIADCLEVNLCRVVTGFNRPNLTFTVLDTYNKEAKLTAVQKLLRALLQEESEGGILIYTGTRNSAEEVAAFVRDVVAVKAEHYHAGLHPQTRRTIQESFLTGQLPLVAATNAFGMGIDRPDVRLVIHYQLPGSLEAYYQEAGRAGRDGLPAQAVLLYDPADRSLQDYFIENTFPSLADFRTLYEMLPAQQQSTAVTIYDLCRQSGLRPVTVTIGLEQLELAGAIERDCDQGAALHLRTQTWHEDAVQQRLKKLQGYADHRRQQLREMIAYAEADGCRRRHILLHFGDQEPAPATSCCDNCLKSFRLETRQPTLDPAIEGLIVACVRSHPGQLTRSGIAKVLVGSTSNRIQTHRNSPFYGQLKGRSRKAVTAMVDKLIDERGLVLHGRRVTTGECPSSEPGAGAPNEPGLEQRIVAWGEGGNTERVPDLIAALRDDRYNVRRLAVSALGKLRDDRAVDPLLNLLACEEYPQIRQYAVKALGKIGNSRARPVLLRVAADENEKYYTRNAARSALKRLRKDL